MGGHADNAGNPQSNTFVFLQLNSKKTIISREEKSLFCCRICGAAPVCSVITTYDSKHIQLYAYEGWANKHGILQFS